MSNKQIFDKLIKEFEDAIYELDYVHHGYSSEEELENLLGPYKKAIQAANDSDMATKADKYDLLNTNVEK
jgi:hypothetical protein